MAFASTAFSSVSEKSRSAENAYSKIPCTVFFWWRKDAASGAGRSAFWHKTDIDFGQRTECNTKTNLTPAATICDHYQRHNLSNIMG